MQDSSLLLLFRAYKAEGIDIKTTVVGLHVFKIFIIRVFLVVVNKKKTKEKKAPVQYEYKRKPKEIEDLYL